MGSLELTVWAIPDPMGLLRSTKGDSPLLLAGDDLPVEATGVPFAGGVGEAISSELVSASHPESRRSSVSGEEWFE